jgi:SpoVK/Ycf46/Vps4 family AAA+-type ATPase
VSPELIFPTDPVICSPHDLDLLISGLRSQISGLAFDHSSVGVLFEVRNGRLPGGRVICRVDEVSHDVLAAGPDVKISVANPQAIPALDGIRRNQEAQFAELIAGLAQEIAPYISNVSVSVPDDTAAVEHAKTRLGSLVGIPADEILADVTSRIRDANSLDAWSMRHYGTRIAGTFAVRSSTPFILLSGDPGTGKSVLVHQLPALVCHATQAPLLFVQLNGRLRGNGIQGRAGTELVNVFDSISKLAGKYHVPALVFLDEAEAVAGTRAASDMSSGTLENTAIVDALIVALDTAMASQKAKMVFICASNLLARIDPAIVRRATTYSFERPSRQARQVILQNSLGDAVDANVLTHLNSLLDRPGTPLTAADVLSQVVAAAIREAARRDTPIDPERLATLARSAVATPPISA